MLPSLFHLVYFEVYLGSILRPLLHSKDTQAGMAEAMQEMWIYSKMH